MMLWNSSRDHGELDSFEDGPCEAYMSRCLSRGCVCWPLISTLTVWLEGGYLFLSFASVGCWSSGDAHLDLDLCE